MVLDTDVVVAAMRSPRGASAALLRLLDEGGGTLLLSVALALEYEAVCGRAEHRLASGLNAMQTETFVNGVIGLAEPVHTYFIWRPQLHDADDEMVLEVAVNGHADAIVTFNRKDYGDAPAAFGIAILLPGEALKRMKI
ncbi:MAG: putative toxin-antitoxin system toxin component, PIN family [Bryobacteraceae bacterium]